jgi:hypothetical protein
MSKPASVCSTECGTNARSADEGDGGQGDGKREDPRPGGVVDDRGGANSPMIPPAPANPAQVPMALACSSRGSWW